MLGVLEWADGGSERATERLFDHDLDWEPVRATLRRRYGDWGRLERDARAPYRSNQWQYVDTHLNDDHLWADLIEAFEEVTLRMARQMGMFDSRKTAWTSPALSNFVTGDGVWIRPLWDAIPGDLQVNTLTGELETKRAEPDTTVRWVRNPDGTHRPEALGTFWVLFEAWLPHPTERLILSIVPRRDGGPSEAKIAVEKITQLAEQCPGIDGTIWDMALKQSHIDELYKRGLLFIVKTETENGDPRSENLGAEHLVDGSTSVARDIWAIGGHPCLEVIARGETHYPALTRLETVRHFDDATHTYWWTNTYRVPDEPLIPAELRGRELVLRLDNTEEDLRRGKARTSVLRAISQSDPVWPRVHGPRNAGESVNSWIKERLRWERARAMGIPKQRWTILCGAIFANFVASLMHWERVGEPWPDGLPGGKQRRSVPRRLPVRLTPDGVKAFDVLVERGINPDELFERVVLEQASQLG